MPHLPLQEASPHLAIYCTFRTIIPDALLEAIAFDVHEMLKVCVCGGGRVLGGTGSAGVCVWGGGGALWPTPPPEGWLS